MTEDEAIQRCQDGEREAFRPLVERHQDVVFGTAYHLTGALLGRLTTTVHILEMNGESYRLKHSRVTAASQAPDDQENG